MPAGFQVFNDSQILQIDENFVNYVLVAQGSAITNSTNPNYSFSSHALAYVEISSSGRTAPILAIKASHGSEVCVAAGQVSGNTWTWRVAAFGLGYPFDYYIFDVAPVSGDNVGLQVFTAAGAPVFHSDQKPLRVGGVFTSSGEILPFAWFGNQADFGAGRIWAGVQMSVGAGENELEEDGQTNYAWFEGVYSHANGIGVGGVFTRFISGSGIGVVSPWFVSSWLAVDVTDY